MVVTTGDIASINHQSNNITSSSTSMTKPFRPGEELANQPNKQEEEEEEDQQVLIEMGNVEEDDDSTEEEYYDFEDEKEDEEEDDDDDDQMNSTVQLISNSTSAKTPQFNQSDLTRSINNKNSGFGSTNKSAKEYSSKHAKKSSANDNNSNNKSPKSRFTAFKFRSLSEGVRPVQFHLILPNNRKPEPTKSTHNTPEPIQLTRDTQNIVSAATTTTAAETNGTKSTQNPLTAPQQPKSPITKPLSILKQPSISNPNYNPKFPTKGFSCFSPNRSSFSSYRVRSSRQSQRHRNKSEEILGLAPLKLIPRQPRSYEDPNFVPPSYFYLDDDDDDDGDQQQLFYDLEHSNDDNFRILFHSNGPLTGSGSGSGAVPAKSVHILTPTKSEEILFDPMKSASSSIIGSSSASQQKKSRNPMKTKPESESIPEPPNLNRTNQKSTIPLISTNVQPSPSPVAATSNANEMNMNKDSNDNTATVNYDDVAISATSANSDVAPQPPPSVKLSSTPKPTPKSEHSLSYPVANTCSRIILADSPHSISRHLTPLQHHRNHDDSISDIKTDLIELIKLRPTKVDSSNSFKSCDSTTTNNITSNTNTSTNNQFKLKQIPFLPISSFNQQICFEKDSSSSSSSSSSSAASANTILSLLSNNNSNESGATTGATASAVKLGPKNDSMDYFGFKRPRFDQNNYDTDDDDEYYDLEEEEEEEVDDKDGARSNNNGTQMGRSNLVQQRYEGSKVHSDHQRHQYDDIRSNSSYLSKNYSNQLHHQHSYHQLDTDLEPDDQNFMDDNVGNSSDDSNDNPHYCKRCNIWFHHCDPSYPYRCNCTRMSIASSGGAACGIDCPRNSNIGDGVANLDDTGRTDTMNTNDTQSVYSINMQKDFRYFFQHPYARLFIAYFVIFCNFLIFAEDPLSHSQIECSIPVMGNVISFLFTKYPPQLQWQVIKATIGIVSVVFGLIFGKFIFHHILLRRILRLKMFRDESGTWMIMLLCTCLCCYFFSIVYNVLLITFHPAAPLYLINAKMGFCYATFMKIAACGTWLGDFFTAWMITDMMLQDNLYPEWAKELRRYWHKHSNVRIVIFWTGALVIAAIVITIILTDSICWDRLNHGFISTTELSRSFLASAILFMDLLIVMQDWDFPHFVDDLNIKLPGLLSPSYTFEFCRKSLKFPAVEIKISGKWFNYGIIVFVMMLDLNMWKNQIIYDPEIYGQYVDPLTNRIYTVNITEEISELLKINNESSLETNWNILRSIKTTNNRSTPSRNDIQSWFQYKYRATTLNPETGRPLIQSDLLIHSKYFGYPAMMKAFTFVPIAAGFVFFFSLIYLYGRFPPKTDVSIGGRLKKRRHHHKSSWRRERRNDSHDDYSSWPGITVYYPRCLPPDVTTAGDVELALRRQFRMVPSTHQFFPSQYQTNFQTNVSTFVSAANPTMVNALIASNYRLLPLMAATMAAAAAAASPILRPNLATSINNGAQSIVVIDENNAKQHGINPNQVVTAGSIVAPSSSATISTQTAPWANSLMLPFNTFQYATKLVRSATAVATTTTTTTTTSSATTINAPDILVNCSQ